MKIKRYTTMLLIIILYSCCFSFAQDNGNNFLESAIFNFETFKGDQGKGLAVIAGSDIDQDGFKEFFVFDKLLGFTAWDAVKCFEAVGDNDFQLVWEQRFGQDNDDEGHGLAIADLDEDGREELLVCAEDMLYVYEWDGTTFESGGGLPQEKTAEYWRFQDNIGKSLIRQLRVANLDSDPEVEIAMGFYGEQGMYFSIASLPGKDFTNPDWKDEFVDTFIPWRMGGMEIGDFDGDGNMEIFTSNFQDAPTTRIYESNGADTYEIKFTTLPDNLILQPSFDDAFANPVFHDFDGDGDSEIVITDTHGKVFVITKAASNNFEDFGPNAWTFVLNSTDVQSNGFVRSGFLGDLDQDGKDDIYYNDFTAGAVLDLEYQGGPVTDPNSWISYKIYTSHRLVYGQIYPGGDLDGDGKGEIVIAGNGDAIANLHVIENQDVTPVQGTEYAITNKYVLHQNYPNPFNPSTDISYELAETGHVRLDVFSLLGQHIITLVDENQMAGIHKISFDAKGLPSGVYFYRLSSTNFSQQKKMLLMR